MLVMKQEQLRGRVAGVGSKPRPLQTLSWSAEETAKPLTENSLRAAVVRAGTETLPATALRVARVTVRISAVAAESMARAPWMLMPLPQEQPVRLMVLMMLLSAAETLATAGLPGARKPPSAPTLPRPLMVREVRVAPPASWTSSGPPMCRQVFGNA